MKGSLLDTQPLTPVRGSSAPAPAAGSVALPGMLAVMHSSGARAAASCTGIYDAAAVPALRVDNGALDALAGTLVAGDTPDVCAYHDSRIGLSILVAGMPCINPLAVRRGDIAWDTTIVLMEAPVTLRIRVEHARIPDLTGADLAVTQLRALLAFRAGIYAVDTVALADPASYGADAVATARLEHDEPALDARATGAGVSGYVEEFTLLVKRGITSLVSVYYARESAMTTPVLNARRVISQGISWNPDNLARVPRVWPSATAQKPGLGGALSAAYEARAQALSARLDVAEQLRPTLTCALERILHGVDAPWAPLEGAPRAAAWELLYRACAAPAYYAALTACFPFVTTAHELRGLAEMFARATQLAWARSADATGPMSLTDLGAVPDSERTPEESPVYVSAERSAHTEM